jgi:hypothetical protein
MWCGFSIVQDDDCSSTAFRFRTAALVREGVLLLPYDACSEWALECENFRNTLLPPLVSTGAFLSLSSERACALNPPWCKGRVSTTAVAAVWLHCQHRVLVHHMLFLPENSPPQRIPSGLPVWQFAFLVFTLL